MGLYRCHGDSALRTSTLALCDTKSPSELKIATVSWYLGDSASQNAPLLVKTFLYLALYPKTFDEGFLTL